MRETTTQDTRRLQRLRARIDRLLGAEMLVGVNERIAVYAVMDAVVDRCIGNNPRHSLDRAFKALGADLVRSEAR